MTEKRNNIKIIWMYYTKKTEESKEKYIKKRDKEI